jgi:CubicO group peptidase (beta-lactamase class C family)
MIMSDLQNLQKLVQEAIDQSVETGAELGVQVAVYRHGELLVDAVAGVADPATGRPLSSGTPIFSASTGKGVTSTVAHVLVEQGVLDYDTPIVEVWPEFGAHGKSGATLRHALLHGAGVPAVPPDTTPEDLGNWDKMCAAIADAEPWWEPGTKVGYHAVTFGYIIGEIVRRATGKRISQVLREQVAGPLGVADELYFGVPAADLSRLAKLDEAPGNAEFLGTWPPEMPLFKAAPLAVLPGADYGNRTDILTSDIPAGGTMSARGVAKMYAALLAEVDGVRLVSPERAAEISALATADVDQLIGFPIPHALGYNLGRPAGQGDVTAFGMVGMGGSAAYASLATGIAFALTKNRFFAGPSATLEQVDEIVTKAVTES